MEKKYTTWLGIVIVVILVVGGVFVYKYYGAKISNTQLPVSNQSSHPQNQNPMPPAQTPTTTPTPPAQVVGMKTYTNTQYGFSFQYPTAFNSAFANFAEQTPTAVVSPQTSANIDSKGCYKLDIGANTEESTGLINGMTFCESSGGSPGAGQLYSSYYYTILHGGNYITLEYIVHTPNGCDNYMGTANYQNCLDFFNNINVLMLMPIYSSVKTLAFTDTVSVSCTTSSDCPSGDSCMGEGPLVAGQPVKKVCVAPGQAVPL